MSVFLCPSPAVLKIAFIKVNIILFLCPLLMSSFSKSLVVISVLLWNETIDNVFCCMTQFELRSNYSCELPLMPQSERLKKKIGTGTSRLQYVNYNNEILHTYTHTQVMQCLMIITFHFLRWVASDEALAGSCILDMMYTSLYYLRMWYAYKVSIGIFWAINGELPFICCISHPYFHTRPGLS